VPINQLARALVYQSINDCFLGSRRTDCCVQSRLRGVRLRSHLCAVRCRLLCAVCCSGRLGGVGEDGEIDAHGSAQGGEADHLAGGGRLLDDGGQILHHLLRQQHLLCKEGRVIAQILYYLINPSPPTPPNTTHQKIEGKLRN
jgi:hypothetical protein